MHNAVPIERSPIQQWTRRFERAALLVLLAAANVWSQAISVPTSHEVYPFLKRMEARQLLPSYRDAALPLSRQQIARHLQKMADSVASMTNVERATFEFLKEEFHYDLSALAGDPDPSEIRWHLFSTETKEGIMNLDLNAAVSYDGMGERHVRTRSQGFRWYGSFYRTIGWSLNFLDHRQVGTGLNSLRTNTPEPGIVPTKNEQELLEYNTGEAQISVQLGDVQLSVEKMQNVWGTGRRGNIIFSTKAPSYPQFKLRVALASWIDFVYLHAQLNSSILDSSRSYHTQSSSLMDYFRPVDREKYMAAHQLELSVLRGVDVSFGESIVYSDRGPELLYLIPVMFFKSAEHYNNDKDNIQWFLSLDVNLIRNVNVYGTFFIDDLNINDFLKSVKSINEVGYTVGATLYDFPAVNLEATVEYSRLNPWVYYHKYPATNFSSNKADLGHWIGQNADDLWLEVAYRPLRSLALGATYEIFRKGGFADPAYHYERSLPNPPFLFGPLYEERSLGLYGRYQVTRDGFVSAQVLRKRIRDENLGASTPSERWDFTLKASYGIW